MEMNDQVASGTEASPSAKITRDVMARSAKFIFAIARAMMELARPLTSYRVTTAETSRVQSRNFSGAKTAAGGERKRFAFWCVCWRLAVSVSGKGRR
jgi:hypothetical protein